MMTHSMRLHPRPFALVKQGKKTIETRLNDEKRQEISVGDTIEFISRENPEEKVFVRVVSLEKYGTFSELFDSFPPEDFGGVDKENLMSIYQYYSKEDEQKYGVVGIRFELFEQNQF